MSLSTRITVLVVALLGVCAVAAGWAFHGSVHRSLIAELQGNLDVRLLWLGQAVRLSEDELRFRPGAEPAGAAAAWQVALPSGAVLWESDRLGEGESVARARRLRLTRPRRVTTRVSLDSLPGPVVAALRAAVPELEPRRARRESRDAGSRYRVDGTLPAGDYEVRVDTDFAGRVRYVEVHLEGSRRRRREKLQLPDTPDAVRETVRREFPRPHRVDDVDRVEQDGTDVYRVDVHSEGRDVDLTIARDGSLLRKEVELSPADLPAEIREAVAGIFSDLDHADIERQSSGGKVVYRVEGRSAQQEIELTMRPDGTLLDKDIEFRGRTRNPGLAEVPAEVRATIEREGGRAPRRIRLANSSQGRLYRVDVQVGGRDVELQLRADGTIYRRSARIDPEDLPVEVRAAIDRSFGDATIDRAERLELGRTVIYEVGLETAGRKVERLLAPDGTPVRIDASSPFHAYPSRGVDPVELELTARASAAPIHDELGRLVHSMVVVGPLALAIAGLLIAFSVRWQLRPLTSMADAASRIGPGIPDERIEPDAGGLECRRLSEALNSMIARLGAAFEREQRFASLAAHELRTPLAQLRATAEIALRRERSADEYREALDEVLADIESLERLVLSLLRLTRSGAVGVTLRQPVPVASTLRRAIDDLDVEVVDPPDEALRIEGDTELFAAALRNVLENAARYAPGAPPSVEVEATDEIVRVSVSDRGPGVAAHDRERIFEPLTRLDESASGPRGFGFGLGLAIARSTVQAFGGDLICTARTDGEPGAEFVFTFRRA